MRKRLRRLMFPAPKRIEYAAAPDAGTVGLLALALVSLGAPVLEVLLYGPAQGCLIVFAGLGFGCNLK